MKLIKINDDFNTIKPLLGNKVTICLFLALSLFVWQTR